MVGLLSLIGVFVVGSLRRGVAVAGLLFGAAGLVVGPLGDAVAAAVSLAAVDVDLEADSGVERLFASAGVVPGLSSDVFGSVVSESVVERVVDDGATVVVPGVGLPLDCGHLS